MNLELYKFQIRPHHLEQLRTAKRIGAEKTVDDLIKVTKSPIRAIWEGPLYKPDVLGHSELQESAFRQGMLMFIDNYQRLPRDFEIEIASVRDGICRSCVIGLHCYFVNENVVKGENKIIQWIENFVQRYEVPVKRFEVTKSGEFLSILTDKKSLEIVFNKSIAKRNWAWL